jgi:hypothetical protein
MNMSEEHITEVAIADIVMDTGLQMRAGLQMQTVAEYAEILSEGSEWTFPPVELMRRKDGSLVLVDGWHRVEAARRNEWETVSARVSSGTDNQIFEAALAANAEHGLRRTNDDKRKAVAAALKKWPGFDARKIAKKCRVSHTFVSKLKNAAAPGNVATSNITPVAESVGSVATSNPQLTTPPSSPAADTDLAAFDALTDKVQEYLESAAQRVPESMRQQWREFLQRVVEGLQS